ncbi:MAG: fumarate hydratase [Spirochaetales bacterium]|nr:fumarate hydratase [Spirochaetales bacterium]
MRKITVDEIQNTVEDLFIKANFELPDDVIDTIKKAIHIETSPTGKEILNHILKNAAIAHEEKLPLCQDCGVSTIFMEIGQDVMFVEGNLNEAIQKGIRNAYKNNYLRFSIVKSPIDRINSNDNTPGIIHYEIVPGDKVRVMVIPKGGGCENMSRLAMFPPSAGIPEIKKFVLDSVLESGANPCPPIILGIGLGGTFEYAPYLAKKSLLRKIGSGNPDKNLDILEHELLEGINALGIGPQGMGGNITALAVHITEAPCHIASFPVALNFECHSHRTKEAVI